MPSLHSSIQQNTRQTYLYMIVFIILMGVLGSALGKITNLGLTATGSFLIVSGIITWFAYFFSDKLIVRSSGAKPITKEIAADYVKIVESLCSKGKIPIPKLYYIDDDSMNAFATGRDIKHAVVVVTRGLLEKLNANEVEGVVAHELTHIKRKDMLLMSTISIIVGIITIIADMFWYSHVASKTRGKDSSGVIAFIGVFIAFISPLTAMLLKLSVSRKREFVADLGATQLIGSPDGLIKALAKIENDHVQMPNMNNATASLCFRNPFGDDVVNRIFSTHPPIKERIQLLKNIKPEK
jgi:heat shock protein HtpX